MSQEEIKIRQADSLNAMKRFKGFFDDKLYQELSPVAITQHNDPSVDLVGSGTNNYKDLILSSSIKDTGNFLVQPSIRQRNVRKDVIEEETILPNFKSYFNQLCLVHTPENLQNVINDLYEFLVHGIGIENSRLSIRTHSTDNDLIRLLDNSSRDQKIISGVDTPYRHSYGVDKIPGGSGALIGRNSNIYIENRYTGIEQVIGNVIIMEDAVSREAYGIEVGIGLEIMNASYNNIHISDLLYNIPDVETSSNSYRKLKDFCEAFVHLMSQPGRFSKRDVKGKTLRRYAKAIQFLADTLNISKEVIVDYVVELDTLYDINSAVKKTDVEQFIG